MEQAHLKELLALSLEEKLKVIDSLWDSIGSEIPLTPAQSRELERRIALFRQDPSSGKSWDEIRDS